MPTEMKVYAELKRRTLMYMSPFKHKNKTKN